MDNSIQELRFQFKQLALELLNSFDPDEAPKSKEEILESVKGLSPEDSVHCLQEWRDHCRHCDKELEEEHMEERWQSFHEEAENFIRYR